MHYLRQTIIVALLIHLFVSCLARTRFIPDPWPISSPYWEEIADIENKNDNNSNNNQVFARAVPWAMKMKKAFRNGLQAENDERRKKFLGDSANYQGGHSLQGLWALPGRR